MRRDTSHLQVIQPHNTECKSDLGHLNHMYKLDHIYHMYILDHLNHMYKLDNLKKKLSGLSPPIQEDWLVLKSDMLLSISKTKKREKYRKKAPSSNAAEVLARKLAGYFGKADEASGGWNLLWLGIRWGRKETLQYRHVIRTIRSVLVLV